MNNYRTISLSGKHAKDKKAFISVEDYDLISAYSWYVNIQGYAVNSQRIKGTKKKKMIYMHRLIMGLDSELVVDHINHKLLDNRRENLRLCTNAENARNKKPYKKTASSKFKGVSWSTLRDKWQTHIALNYKSINLGYFTDELEAAQAYNEAAKKLHGDFALLNELTQ